MEAKTVKIDELTFEMTKKLRVYLKTLVANNGSDLHIKAGSEVRGRINGRITSYGEKTFMSEKDALLLAKELLRSRFEEFVENKSIDFTYKYDENYRFRVNIFFQVNGISAVFRTIPTALPTFESLKLPSVIQDFCKIKRGLVLVTGPTGSGKTTTLAAMINHMNQMRPDHIITVEDPVEFVYKDGKSLINQRAIGQDAKDFASSLRAALREDPDVILVGEMRDLETIETALHAAETGHLVLSTLHTVDAKETINRIIGMFPGEEHNRITMSLAAVLQGIVSQRLVKTKDNKRAAAVEVLVKNARVENLILEHNDSEIFDAIGEGREIYKSQTFDQALLDLYAQGVIDLEEALSNSSRPNDLKLSIEYYESSVKKTQQEAGEALAVDNDILELKID